MSFFRKSSSGGADGSSSHHNSRNKARKGKEVLETDFEKEYNRLSQSQCTRGFITSNGLDSDFTTLVRNAGMEVFSALNRDTYKRATLKFLATFHDDLAVLGQNTTVRGRGSLKAYFCGTIQNPTIRYFATFLANSLFGKGDAGAMASPEMSVIYSVLYPNMVNKMNLGALLIQHFHR
ncbi:hypothetical protein QYE76_009371 [Lolium multiflorum]|uniref:Arabidopsis retrotransposon Orf1 C-terminal domain-containing protein n=1 Tax=Lolium multiflorum TaxID=4521 RepID=A0AAD8X3I0_LOLMU|nr:hypothetical protein QYE76_009371 [Lolium multiflorum]